ncbi:MAG TPA: RodZ domain-containing protein [Chloroflexia bacterium]|nr:RodZ domain-containing protein [Chloroflexia bacterium]
MPGPGEMLRQAREARGLPLAAAAQETRIRIEYLTAIEDNDFASLPGDVYTRGFLRNYSTFLGLDPSEVMAAYEESRTTPRRATGPHPTQPAPARKRPRKPEPIRIEPLSPTPIDTRVRYAPSFWLMGLVAFVLLIVVYLGYNAVNGVSRVPLATPTVTAQLTPTELIAMLPSVIVENTPVWTPFPTPGGPPVAAATTPQAPGAGPTTTAGAGQPPATLIAGQAPATVAAGPSPVGTVGAGVNVQVSVGSQNAWMQVTLDGKVQFAGTLAAGSTRSWAAQNTIRIRFARGDITSVNVNGVDRGLAADASQTVVTKEWDAAGNERIIQ